MLVGICRIEMFLPESVSLKTKRTVLKSLINRVRNKFNVSIAEVENQDKWQRLSLGIAIVTNEQRIIDSTVSHIINFIENDGRAEIIEHKIELY